MSVVNFSDCFEQTFGPESNRRVFSTLEEFKTTLQRFQRETGAYYSVRSSKRHAGEVIILKYVCVFIFHCYCNSIVIISSGAPNVIIHVT